MKLALLNFYSSYMVLHLFLQIQISSLGLCNFYMFTDNETVMKKIKKVLYEKPGLNPRLPIHINAATQIQ